MSKPPTIEAPQPPAIQPPAAVPKKPSRPSKRGKRTRAQRKAINALKAKNRVPKIVAKGPPTKLDPDQATYDRTIQTITACGVINCTVDETAAVLGVARETLVSFFERYPGAKELYEIGRDQFRPTVRKNQLKLSESQATMAIHLGVNYLGQRKAEDPIGGALNLNIENLTVVQLTTILQRIKNGVVT